MSDPAREDLLGYLLQALDEPEHALVEQRLGQDPRLREELARVRGGLARLGHAWREVDPPPGLATRTCAFVAARAPRTPAETPGLAAVAAASGMAGGPARERPAPAPFADEAPAARTGHLRWQDMAVAAVVFVAVGSLVFPAIQSSRFQSQVTACQDNLRALGAALTRYSEDKNGVFPPIPTRGPLNVAGIYAPTLLSEGYLTDAACTACPAAPRARGRAPAVASLEELRSAPGHELPGLLAQIGGDYGYSLGHTEGGQYRPTKNLRRPTFVVLADAPSPVRPGHQSENHASLGQNAWFEDGHVQFVRSTRAADLLDDFFLNNDGWVAAGVDADDSVVAPSDARPLVLSGGD